MKTLIGFASILIILIQSASAQYLNIEIVSPEDGVDIHGGTLTVNILFTYTGPFTGASVEGFADGQLWFYGAVGGDTILGVPFKTNVKGPHVLSVTVFDGFTSDSHTITVYR